MRDCDATLLANWLVILAENRLMLLQTDKRKKDFSCQRMKKKVLRQKFLYKIGKLCRWYIRPGALLNLPPTLLFCIFPCPTIILLSQFSFSCSFSHFSESFHRVFHFPLLQTSLLTFVCWKKNVYFFWEKFGVFMRKRGGLKENCSHGVFSMNKSNEKCFCSYNSPSLPP